MAVSDDDQQLAELLSQLTDRVLCGEDVDIETVCREHPALSGELRRLWGAVMVADAAAESGPSKTHSSQGADPTAFTLPLPCHFGDYELLEEVGRGGMGVVYRAKQLSLNRPVAIKMILRGQLASEEDRRRFQAEAEAAGRLTHPHIVPVYEVGQHDGRPYFSMEYVRGETLLDLLADGPLPPKDAARILSAVTRAIAFAHKHGVLHRDLKPSNIMMDENGQPHLTDFGLAKQVQDPVNVTRSGAIVGTPAYMPPELAAGSRGAVSPASDVYSLGAILYHMLTGQPPFSARSPVDIVMMVLEQDPEPPRVLNSSVNRDLEMIAIRCLQKPSDLRYASATALADDLDAFLQDEPIAARSGRFSQIVARLFRETHHATVLENWGLLWMWHSLVIFVACLATQTMYWQGVTNRWYYFILWTVGFQTWAAVFWALRRRMGPVTFVERQIAHVWAASLVGIMALFPLESLMNLRILRLSPLLALISGMVFLVKAGILSGAFYLQAMLLFGTAFVMALWPEYGHLVFGVVSACCFFFPGLKYYRRGRNS